MLINVTLFGQTIYSTAFINFPKIVNRNESSLYRLLFKRKIEGNVPEMHSKESNSSIQLRSPDSSQMILLDDIEYLNIHSHSSLDNVIINNINKRRFLSYIIYVCYG